LKSPKAPEAEWQNAGAPDQIVRVGKA